jgi:hypothetical protein
VITTEFASCIPTNGNQIANTQQQKRKKKLQILQSWKVFWLLSINIFSNNDQENTYNVVSSASKIVGNNQNQEFVPCYMLSK